MNESGKGQKRKCRKKFQTLNRDGAGKEPERWAVPQIGSKMPFCKCQGQTGTREVFCNFWEIGWTGKAAVNTEKYPSSVLPDNILAKS